jgi:hypothetical protein
MLALQRRSEYNHASFYPLFSFSPAKRGFVPRFAALNLMKKKPKNSSEDAKGVPRKFDRPPLGLQLLREFSSSPRWKSVCYYLRPDLL